jgi:hypothetical protein
MDITISIPTGPRATALTRALVAYNTSNPSLTAEQFVQKLVNGQLDSLVASYVTTKLSKLDFLDRFSVEERVTIRTAAKQNGVVQDYLELLNAAQEVNLASERTTAGVNALEAAGLLAEGRASEILEL